MKSFEKDFSKIDEQFMIVQRKAEGKFSMPYKHYHDAYEIYYLLSGERYYFINDRTYHIMKGDLVFINKNVLHKTSNVNKIEHERILINFKKEFLSNFLSSINDIDLFSTFSKEVSAIKLDINKQKYVEILLQKIIEEDKYSLPGYETYLKLGLIELLIFINRNTEKMHNVFFEYPDSLFEKISEIAKYLNKNYMNSITLEMISKEFYISPYYFCRTFKNITSISFIEYINKIRIKEAQALLCKTTLNVTQIAEKTGFNSTTNFGRVFKSLVGLPPLKYKKLYGYKQMQ